MRAIRSNSPPERASTSRERRATCSNFEHGPPSVPRPPWAEALIEETRDRAVTNSENPSPLFWFIPSEFFLAPKKVTVGGETTELNPAQRHRVQAAVQELLKDRSENWHVQIVGSQTTSQWEMMVDGPNDSQWLELIAEKDLGTGAGDPRASATGNP